MITKILILFVSVFISCDNEKSTSNDCELNFQSVGVRDFKLGEELNQLLKVINDYSETKLEDNSSLILFDEYSIICKEKKKVSYKLILKDRVLIGYTFMVKIEKNRKGLESFKLFLNEAKENNDFIMGEKYSHMKTSNNCKRFIRTHSIGIEKYFFGGIHAIDAE